jgi:hypothetical protein
MLTQKDFQNTEMMLNASNASALIPDLAEIMPRLWEEARFYGKGTSWVAQHPITLLWVGKIASLSYGVDAPYGKWVKAHSYIQARLNGVVVGDSTDMWLPENEYGKVA